MSERVVPHGGRAVVDGRRGEESPHHSTPHPRDEGDTVDQLLDLPSKRELTK